MKIKSLFKMAESARGAGLLYRAAVEQARRPAFYALHGVPDTIDGRFDMVALHVFLILHRLKRDGQAQGAVGQALFDLMFADMDGSLREMGVGDLSVGRKIKQMATGFYGRVAAYETGLASRGGELERALRRNLYGTAAPAPAQVAAVESYVRHQAAFLAGQPGDALMRGEVAFAPPEEKPA
jgi:cytochrome b pre-mRNA-processing protein 3